MFESFLGVNPWTALFILLNTLTIYFVAKKYLFRPVMNIITQRQQEIDGMYQAAGAAKEQAEAMRSEYRQKLTSAQQTGEHIVKEAVARGHSHEEEIIRKAYSDAAAILDNASRLIAMAKKKALNDTKDEVSVLAIAIAGKVVGRALTNADQKNLIDSFIDELGGEI